MYFYLLSLFLLSGVSSSSQLQKTFIQNIKYPICINCKHFLPYDSDNKLGKCKLFGIQNAVTGHIDYDFASICRSKYLDTCGIEGKYFEEKTVQEPPLP